MPLTTLVANTPALASDLNDNFALCVLTDTARTITATHTFSITQTFSDGITVSEGLNLDTVADQSLITFKKSGTRTVTVKSTAANTLVLTDSAGAIVTTFNNGALALGGALSGVTTLAASSTVTLSGLTASQAVFTNASKELVSNAITGSGNVVMSASPTLTGTITAAAITASGAITGNAGFTGTTYSFTADASGGPLGILEDSSGGAASHRVSSIKRNGSEVGSITVTDVATAFNTSSDERLKEWSKLPDVGAIIDGVQVVDAAFKRNTTMRYPMMLAQQAHRFAPFAVTPGGGDPDKQPWQMDYSKLVPVLWAEVKSLRGRLAAAGIN